VQRLKTREQFQAVLAIAPKSKSAHFAMHCSGDAVMTAQSEICIGAMIPKRWAKRAVTRNLIKRQIYNMAQRYGAMLAPQAHVVRMRASFDTKKFKSASSAQLKQLVRTEMEELFSSLCYAAQGITK
jgi:ribonuclease P protein component